LGWKAAATIPQPPWCATSRARGEILSLGHPLGQTALHAAFGGVVPEIAARAHAGTAGHCVEQALARRGCRCGMDGIAVTAGPGLIGGVLSG
jgi:N6-L-threonylcarbamoyladenine synthase